MSFPFLPVIIEAVPLVLGALGLGFSFKSLRNRLIAEDTLVKEIENNKKDIEREYAQYLKARTEQEKSAELEDIRQKIKALAERMSKENSNLISSALFQASTKGRDSYLKKLLHEAHIDSIETANKQNQTDA